MLESKRIMEKRWFPYLGLLLVLVLSYPEIFFAGRSFHPGLIYPLGVTHRNTEVTPAPNSTFHAELSTGAYYEAPINEWMGRKMREGEFPLWNPHQSLGGPLLAQYSSRLLFPFQLIENLMGARAFDLFLLGRQFLAGVGTFLLARNLGALPLTALITAFCFALSGVFTWFFSLEQFTNPALVLPFLLLSIERLTEMITPLRFLGTTLCVALMMYAGQPEVALYGLFFGALFLIVIAISRKRLYISAAFGALALCFGLMIAAPQILVFLSHIPYAVNHLHEAGGSAGSASPTPLTVMRLVLFPTLSTYPSPPKIYPLNGHWDSLGGYLGILVPFLTIAGLSSSLRLSKMRGIILFLILFSVGVLAKNLGYPPFSWLGSLPLFDQVWSPRWAGPSWVLAALLALSLNLQSMESDRSALSLRSRGVLYLSLAALLFLCWKGQDVIPTSVFEHGKHYRDLEQAPQYFWPSVYLPLCLSAILLITAAVLVRFRSHFPGYMMGIALLIWVGLMYAIPRGLSPQWMLAVQLSCFIPILGSILVARRYSWALLSALAPTVCVLLSCIYSSEGLPVRESPYSTPKYASFLDQHMEKPYRVMAADGILYGNTASPLALNELQGIWAVPLKEYFHFYWDIWRNPVIRLQDRGYWFSGLSRVSKDLTHLEPEDSTAFFSIFSLAGVKYFILPAGARPNTYFTEETVSRHLRRVYEDAEVALYENRSVSPRAFLARKLTEENDADRIFQALKSPTHDPQAVFIPKGSQGGLLEADTSDTAHIRVYQSNRIELETVAKGPRLVVLTDAFAPGWSAKVNGEDSPIIRANHLFRGIAVPQGTSQIVLSYCPEGLREGIVLALVGVFLAAGVALSLRRTI